MHALARYADALIMKKKAVQIRMQILGKRNIDTARSLNSCGVTHGALGRHSEALACLEKALSIRLEVLGELHVDTARSMDNVRLQLSFSSFSILNMQCFGWFVSTMLVHRWGRWGTQVCLHHKAMRIAMRSQGW